MKKVIPSFILACTVLASSTAYAATNNSIEINGTAVASDVKPEVKDNRTMVPLRVISENLGAKVAWTKTEVTLTKNNMKVILKPNSTTAVKNGTAVQLDVKPYVVDNRIIVPLRFIAETFGCTVNYSNSTVTVESAPLVINGVQVNALQQEYHMTMGGIVQQVNGNAYNEAIYTSFETNKGAKVDAPANYSWSPNYDIPGSYLKTAQYDFLDKNGKSVKSYEIYTLLQPTTDDAGKSVRTVLLYDVTGAQWYSFSDSARQAIDQLMVTADKNGFLKVISNTIV
ncbi:copper amine oxidase N-terminal domain-containing protein [Paenibacillus rhizovicinus]|uniref:Copper amine oxidase N-terminal domain-containing protein n=1 Tax=Paenibacillus rhizovicinus TaxID=2704463 RepID=A0A6C0P188_9BACL|nr:copper amine oxidase N-terminal domain-containing protein [Paenibacillus rhizovicinus]QHW31996.1 copper amine oxidase N-terminal domain-containing protein [Paenibacillus rhizovicinus]